jgi:hypothetical protein
LKRAESLHRGRDRGKDRRWRGGDGGVAVDADQPCWRARRMARVARSRPSVDDDPYVDEQVLGTS